VLSFRLFLCLRDEPEAEGLELKCSAPRPTRPVQLAEKYLSAGLCLRRMGVNEEAEEHCAGAVLDPPRHDRRTLQPAAGLNFERQMKDAEIYCWYALATTTRVCKFARANKDSAAEPELSAAAAAAFSRRPAGSGGFSKSVPTCRGIRGDNATASNLLRRSLGQTLAAERRAPRAVALRRGASGCT